MRLNYWRNHSAEFFGGLLQRQRSSACRKQSNECSIPTACRSTPTVCLNSHCASMLHSPTQPLPRGLVGNGINEPPKPLRRMNNKHTNTRSGMQLRSLASTHCNHGTKGSSKPQLQSQLFEGKRCDTPNCTQVPWVCETRKYSQLQVKRPSGTLTQGAWSREGQLNHQ